MTPAAIVPQKRVFLLFSIGLLAFLAIRVSALIFSFVGCAEAELVSMPIGYAVILVALFYSDKLGLPKLTCGRKILTGAIWGGITLALCSALTWGWSLMMEKWGMAVGSQLALDRVKFAGPAEFSFLFISAGLWGPFVEEIYFRGWWQTKALEKLSAPWAILLVAIVFATLHANVALLPGLLLAGVMFGIAAACWGIGAAVSAHIVFNCVAIYLTRTGLI